MVLFLVFLYFNDNVKKCDSLDKVRVVFVMKIMPIPHL
jgi:hypothetical protein